MSKKIIFILGSHEDKEEKTNNNYCNKHSIPAEDLCKDYQADTGPGILMKDCSNCYWFNDRSIKYEKLIGGQNEYTSKE